MVYEKFSVVLDPHTAVGFFAPKDKIDNKVPMVNLGTADPAKFPDAVMDAIGKEPEIPESLSNILKAEETFFKLEKNENNLIEFIEDKVSNRND